MSSYNFHGMDLISLENFLCMKRFNTNKKNILISAFVIPYKVERTTKRYKNKKRKDNNTED